MAVIEAQLLSGLALEAARFAGLADEEGRQLFRSIRIGSEGNCDSSLIQIMSAIHVMRGQNL